MTALQTLLHPFETGMLPPLAAGMRGLVFNAQPGMRRPEGFDAELFLVQGFRPLYLALERSGHAVAPEPQGDGYEIASVIAGRHRRQNELWIAQALARTSPGGVVLVAGDKTDGIASLRKRVGDLLPIAGSASKFHGAVFWLERPEDGQFIERAIAALTSSIALVDGRYFTAVGGFSSQRVDPGSRLLADSLPQDVGGAVADFCAGWGYLSARVAGRPDVASLDLYEADFASLQAARKNLTGPRPFVGFHWHDLAAEPVLARYDAIVMNPPFHQGRAAEPDLGTRMVAAAKPALRSGGRLFLVANRALPYERALADGFRTHGEIVRDAAFKVLWAVR